MVFSFILRIICWRLRFDKGNLLDCCLQLSYFRLFVSCDVKCNSVRWELLYCHFQATVAGNKPKRFELRKKRRSQGTVIYCSDLVETFSCLWFCTRSLHRTSSPCSVAFLPGSVNEGSIIHMEVREGFMPAIQWWNICTELRTLDPNFHLLVLRSIPRIILRNDGIYYPYSNWRNSKTFWRRNTIMLVLLSPVNRLATKLDISISWWCDIFISAIAAE